MVNSPAVAFFSYRRREPPITNRGVISTQKGFYIAMENKENRIIFDWLTFTSKVDTLESIFDLLGLKSDDFIECEKGWNGYKKRLTYENISICYDGSKFFDKSGVMHDMGICVNMSGKGCRAFESLSNIDFFGLFKSISNSDNYNITRLDVAFDDFDNVLDIEMLEKDTRNRNFVSKFKKGKIETSWDCEDYGVCIYFGTRSSELMFRIYDKLAEQKIVNSDEHWVRFEMMLKNDRASFFVENLMNGINISELFFNVLNNYLRFVVPDENDSNKSRWKNTEYWDKFLEYYGIQSLYKAPGTDFDEDTMLAYLNTYSGQLYTLCSMFGIEFLLYYLMKRSEYKFNPKYELYLKQKGIAKKTLKTDLVFCLETLGVNIDE